MGRRRRYVTAAERQRAYRVRRAAERPKAPRPRRESTRPPSQPKRLAAVDNAVQELLSEYEEWRENLPENLACSDQADRLDAAIESLAAVAHILEDIDLPRGFGRD